MGHHYADPPQRNVWGASMRALITADVGATTPHHLQGGEGPGGPHATLSAATSTNAAGDGDGPALPPSLKRRLRPRCDYAPLLAAGGPPFAPPMVSPSQRAVTAIHRHPPFFFPRSRPSSSFRPIPTSECPPPPRPLPPAPILPALPHLFSSSAQSLWRLRWCQRSGTRQGLRSWMRCRTHCRWR